MNLQWVIERIKFYIHRLTPYYEPYKIGVDINCNNYRRGSNYSALVEFAKFERTGYIAGE